MTAAPMQSRIADLLQDYAAELENLAAALDDEHTALLARNVSALERSTGKKQALLRVISGLERERDNLLASMTENRQPVDNDKAIVQLREKIKATLGRCRERNELNGAIIEISSQFNQRLLGLMLGSPDNDQIYDATGKNQVKLPNQSVAII